MFEPFEDDRKKIPNVDVNLINIVLFCCVQGRHLRDSDYKSPDFHLCQ